MAAVVVIRAAEVEGVIPSKQFGGMHHQADRLLCRQHFIKVDLEILVAEVDFNKVEIAAGSKALDVVITNRQAKAVLESVGARRGGRGFKV